MINKNRSSNRKCHHIKGYSDVTLNVKINKQNVLTKAYVDVLKSVHTLFELK